MRSSTKLFPWLQLLRLPNVFTAVADVTMGYIVTQRDLEPYLQFGLLVAASCSLYLSGMVLNDVFDAEVDAREQPHRPIPSGRVSLFHAQRLGWGLWLIGIALAENDTLISLAILRHVEATSDERSAYFKMRRAVAGEVVADEPADAEASNVKSVAAAGSAAAEAVAATSDMVQSLAKSV